MTLAFWLRPDWSGGDNLADPSTVPFWTLPPLPEPTPPLSVTVVGGMTTVSTVNVATDRCKRCRTEIYRMDTAPAKDFCDKCADQISAKKASIPCPECGAEQCRAPYYGFWQCSVCDWEADSYASPSPPYPPPRNPHKNTRR